MDRARILGEVKFELAKLIETLDYKDINKSIEEIDKYLQLLKCVSKLSNPSVANYNDDKDEMFELYDKKSEFFLGQLKRELKGGSIGSFGIFVPEYIVRELELKNGDWVRAKACRIEKARNGVFKTIYEYGLVKKLDVELPTDRKEIKFANVEYDDILKEYYIYSSYNDKLPVLVRIPEYVVNKFKLEVGDLVDYAYFGDDVLHGEFLWKHEIELAEIPKVKPQIKKNNADSEEAHVYDDTLSGFMIAVAGCENMKSAYEEEVVRRGGEFIFTTGDESPLTLESKFTNANIIVMIIDHIGHGGMEKVRTLGKRLGIPIKYARKLGRDSFINIVMEELTKQPSSTFGDE